MNQKSIEEFRAQLNQYCNISSVHDYYGMVEKLVLFIWSVSMVIYTPLFIQI